MDFLSPLVNMINLYLHGNLLAIPIGNVLGGIYTIFNAILQLFGFFQSGIA
jgi:hypothetical protein